MKKSPLLILVMVITLINLASAQPSPPDTSRFAGLESFMDGTIQSYMETNHIAGATLAIIQNGHPLLVKGYGFSDRARRTRVVADRTLFRIGSISKLFVWTAVMQQVEQGRLDLNTNVNKYLEDLEIPPTYPEPITLKHLMTHTAGFEERIIGLFARDSTALRPLGEILSDELPARVRPPGQFASYSNHGTALAAYIVEQVTGQQFLEYVRQNILDPLGMEVTTFQQPLPASLQSRMSNGYAYRQGEYIEKPFEYVPLAPVGAASTTAADMIPFMQAHLNLGHYQGNAILDSATAQLMQSPAFRHAEDMNPMRYGFIDMSQNGIDIFGHGGDTFWFHSMMALFPDQDLGFFLSFNSEGGGRATREVLSAFVDQYFPDNPPPADTLALSREYLQRFAGNYRANRYPHKRFTKILALMNPISVSVTEDRTLKTMRGDEGTFWVPIDSLTFRKAHSREAIAFEDNLNGVVTHLFFRDLPIIAFEKVSTLSSRGFHLTILVTAVLFFLITLFYWPFAHLVRRNYRPSLTRTEPLPLYFKIIAWINSLMMLIFYLGLVLSVGGPKSIVYGVATSIKIILVLPIVSLILTLAMIYLSMQAWRYSTSGFWSRLSFSLLTVVSLVSLWQLYFWNLLGFWY